MNSERPQTHGAAEGPSPWPRRLLAAQMLMVIVLGVCLGWWKVHVAADSVSYVDTSQMAWRDALVSTRTLGYPLLLRLVRGFSPQCDAIPWIHLGALCGSIFVLDAGARRFGSSAWDAFAISSATLYAALPLRTQVSYVLTDFPSIIMGVAAVGCLLWLVADRRRAVVWSGLLLAVAAAYHIRPVYVFLLPLVPCLGVLLLRLRAGTRGLPRGQPVFFATLLAACLLPWAAYCSLRLFAVGQFGLVSFAGYNLSGLAVELLDSRMANSQLPVAYRPLAQEILAERARLGMQSAFRGYYVDMRLYEDHFAQSNIYGIAVPVAKRMYGDDSLICDQVLVRFSRNVIRLSMGKYLLWVAYYLPRAVVKVLAFQWITWLLAPLAILLAVVRRIAERPARPRDSVRNSDKSLLYKGMLWVAPAYFAAYVLVLCLSGTYADSRLVVPAGVFVPALLVMWCMREGRGLYRIQRERYADSRVSQPSVP